jgi:hypothetical protein
MDTQDLQDKTQPILCILCIHVGNRLSSYRQILLRRAACLCVPPLAELAGLRLP